MNRISPRGRRALKLAFTALLVSSCNRSPATATPSAQAEGGGVVAAAPAIASDALRSAATDAEVRALYENNGWQPIWSATARRSLEQSLADRARDGLDHVDFLKDAGAAATPAQREVALTRAALHYAAALAHGLTDPAKLHAVYTIPRPDADLAGPLAEAIAQGRLQPWLDGLAPRDDAYTGLSSAYLQLREKPPEPDGGPIRASGLIHVGDSDKRVPAIARHLVEAEYLPEPPPAPAPSQPASGRADPADGAGGPATDPSRYTPDMAEAVKALQRDYGIADDGVIGPDTLEVLNLRPGDRARAIAVAMERLRWLSRTPPATRIDVNTAAARLDYYRDGVLVDSRKVITGQPGKETPQLRAPLFRLVANPTWTIPKSIQHGEMAGVSGSYLRRHNMVMRDGWIVQKSGPSNALGLVKFDMKDDQAIYLHDTSAPSLFERSERHRSHGCVRVEDALGFAQRIAEDEGIADQWQRARDSGEQSFVPLPHSIPVRLLYQNVFVAGSGKVAFRTDPYGWNAPIAKALGFGTMSTARARADSTDIGP